LKIKACSKSSILSSSSTSIHLIVCKGLATLCHREGIDKTFFAIELRYRFYHQRYLLWCQCWLLNLANVLAIEFHPLTFFLVHLKYSEKRGCKWFCDNCTQKHDMNIKKNILHHLCTTLFFLFSIFYHADLGIWCINANLFWPCHHNFFCFHWRRGGLLCRKKTWQTRMKLVSKQVDSRSQSYEKKNILDF